MSTDLVIARLDAARLALSEARSIQDTKKILDVAAAAEIYARRQKLSDENIAFANAVKVEALRQLGEFLRDAPMNPGSRFGGSSQEPPEKAPTLAEQGIDKKTSMVAQRLAALPQEKYEAVKAGTLSIAKAVATKRPASNSPPTSKADGTGTAADPVGGGAESAPEAPESATTGGTLHPVEASGADSDGDPSVDEQKEAEAYMAAARDNLALVLLDEDDPLKAVCEENLRLKEQVRALESRIAGLLNENAAWIRQIKSLQRKAKKG